jgi:cytochrome c biogenesis protein CcmG/thiol:disulfide interchange protein DsbE
MTLLRQKSLQNKAIAMILFGSGLFLLGVMVLLLINGKAANNNSLPSFSVPAKVNYVAPELNLSSLDGKNVSLQDYRGQVTLVNNWATWCPPCQAEMPDLEAFYQAYHQDGFTVVAIESGESKAEVAEFVRHYQLTFPVWLDPNMQALTAFHFSGLPSTYVIDRQGHVRLAWAGAITYAMMEKYISPLLKE